MSLARVLPVTACVALTAAASAAVDVEVRNGDRVLGTLNPGTEEEVVRFAAPAGAKLSVVAAGAKRGPAVAIALRDEGDAALGTPKPKGRTGASVAATAAASGTFRVFVTSKDGAATGDYTATVKWTSVRRVAPQTVAALEPEASGAATPFGADAGAKLRVTAAARGGALAHIVSVSGPDGDLEGVDDGLGARTDRTPLLTLPAAGDYTVTVRNDGDAAGDVVVSATIVPPKPSKRTIDIRAAKTGAPGGSEDDAVFARVVDAEGGSVVVPDVGDGGLTDISGSSIDVAPGVLPTGLALVIGTAPDLDVPGADETALGPTVFFGPEGITFGTKTAPKTVSLSIPLDLGLVGGNTGLVEVWVREKDGSTTLVPPPYDFTSKPGFVVFPTSGFSAFRAITKSAPAPVNPGTIADYASAADVAFVRGLDGVPDAEFAVAAGTARVVSTISRPATGGPLQFTDWAGGGAQTADGTYRTSFDFQGDVVAVAALPDADVVYAATSTRIFRIAANGNVTRIAGTGTPGDSGENVPATSAQFSDVSDLVVTLNGDVFFIDGIAGRIRRIDGVTGNIVNEFGTGSPTFGTDGIDPAFTSFAEARALTFRPNGGFYVCDGTRLRALNRADQTNVTVAGDASGSAGSGGSGGLPTSARFRSLSGITQDPSGVLFVSDALAHQIWRIDLSAATGPSATVVAGVADSRGSASDGQAPPFPLDGPRSLLGGGSGVIWIEGNGKVRSYVFPN